MNEIIKQEIAKYVGDITFAYTKVKLTEEKKEKLGMDIIKNLSTYEDIDTVEVKFESSKDDDKNEFEKIVVSFMDKTDGQLQLKVNIVK